VDRRLVVGALLALALELWMLGSDFHFLWKPPRVPVGAVRVAEVVSVSSEAKARSPLQLNWFSLKPGQELFEGDAVATIGESEVSLRLRDGQVIRLGSNSLLVLRRTAATTRRVVTLSLLEGRLERETPASAPTARERSRLEIEVGGRRFLTHGESDFSVESGGAGGPRVNAAEPGALEPVGLPGSLAATTDEPQLAIAPQQHGAVPLAPRNGAVVDLTGLDTFAVSLRWWVPEAGPGVRLELARNPAFSEGLISMEMGTRTSFEFHPAAMGSYWWRLVRERAGGSVVSPASRFEIRWQLAAPTLKRPSVTKAPAGVEPHKDMEAPVLRRPVIRVREGGPSSSLEGLARRLAWALDRALFSDAAAAEPAVSGGAHARPPRFTVDLEWNAVKGATGYLVEIATDVSFEHKVYGQEVPRALFRWGAEEAGFYYWRVAAIGPDGAVGPFSEFMTFKLKAERNVAGDETTYDSYRAYDEYAEYDSRLRILYGLQYGNYYFSSSDAGSPSGLVTKASTWTNWEGQYERRLDPHTSIESTLRYDRTAIRGSSFIPPVSGLGAPTQYETLFSIGLERRIFEPKHLITVHAGLAVSIVALPALTPTGGLAYDNFGFFGFYGLLGIERALFARITGSFEFGGMMQDTGDSFRATQLAELRLKKPMIEDRVNFGLSVAEELSAYRMGDDTLSGQAHSLEIRPMVLLEFVF
jgi:hypothetical protein